MKKLIALSFLMLYLNSLAGMLVAHAIAVYQSDRFYEKQIGRGFYNVQDLTEVRIPVTVPQTALLTGYENMHGMVQFAHNTYNYVAIKISKSAIYLLCVPNYKTTRYCHTNVIDARHIPDAPVEKKNHVPFEKAPTLSIFCYNHTNYHFLAPFSAINCLRCYIDHQAVSSAIAVTAQPPENC